MEQKRQGQHPSLGVLKDFRSLPKERGETQKLNMRKSFADTSKKATSQKQKQVACQGLGCSSVFLLAQVAISPNK